MRLTTSFFAFFFFFASIISAQTPDKIVAIAWGGDPGNTFQAFDLAFKTDSTLNNIGTANVMQGCSTYDKINDRYFSLTSSLIYCVDGKTGLVVDSFAVPGSYNGIEYDKNFNSLRFAYYESSLNDFYYGKIDLATGNFSYSFKLLKHPIYYGESTFDSNNSRYFRMSNDGAEVIDSTGNTIDVVPLFNLKNIEYNSIDDRLVGTYFNGPYFCIGAVGVYDHQFELIDSIQVNGSVLAAETTFDDINQRYFFRTMNSVYQYDLANRTWDNYPNALPNCFGMEYVAPKIPINTTGINETTYADEVTFYPNPTADYGFFKGLKPGQHISLVSPTGQIYCLLNVTTDKYYLDLKNYPAGEYIYRLTEGNNLLKTGKIIRR